MNNIYICWAENILKHTFPVALEWQDCRQIAIVRTTVRRESNRVDNSPFKIDETMRVHM